MADDYGTCLANVNSFVKQYKENAQSIANKLENGVTAAEVLATSGNETLYGTSDYVAFGNFFGLHGHGPAGTHYTPKKVAVMKFNPLNGFLVSGQVFIQRIKPHLTAGIGDNPQAFFQILHEHGYATPNPNYAAMMVAKTPNRGPYTLVMACLSGK